MKTEELKETKEEKQRMRKIISNIQSTIMGFFILLYDKLLVFNPNKKHKRIRSSINRQFLCIIHYGFTNTNKYNNSIFRQKKELSNRKFFPCSIYAYNNF